MVNVRDTGGESRKVKWFSVWHLEESKGRKAGNGDHGDQRKQEMERQKPEMQADNQEHFERHLWGCFRLLW